MYNVYKAYVPIECGKCDFTTKRVRLLLRHPCRGNKNPEDETRIEDVREKDVKGSGDAESSVSQETHEETAANCPQEGEAKVKAPLSKEEKVIRNAKKRQRTKRKVAELRAEAKALGYRTQGNKKPEDEMRTVAKWLTDEIQNRRLAKYRHSTEEHMTEDVTDKDARASGDAESNMSQETHEETTADYPQEGETKVKAPLSKEEKVMRNAKKRQRTKRKVAKIREEAKALGYRTPALMGLRENKKKRKMNKIPFVLNFPAEETKVTTMAKFRYALRTWNYSDYWLLCL